MNKREDHEHALKIYSKTHGAHIFIVLKCAFVSVCQLEKRACTLFAGENSDWGNTYSWSCTYKDIQCRRISFPSCVRELEKLINNEKCSKCWNWDADGATCSDA